MPKFDRKSFNEKAFGKYMETVPRERLNTLIKANIFKSNQNIRDSFSSQTGSAYAVIPMIGRLKGTPANYDGTTSYGDAKKLNTYEQGVVVIGRKDKFSEQDFSYDITSGVDFMSQVGSQLGDYWDTANEDILISIVKGLYASSVDFANAHTSEVTNFTETALNSAIQKASGDRKQKFSLAIMHSAKATELENLKVLNYLKYTDPNGIESQLNLAQWNGKLVLVDDEITTVSTDSYALTEDEAVVSGKTYYTRSGSEGAYVYTAVAEPSTSDIATYYEKTTTIKYVTYAFGAGSFDYEDIGARVPYEMDRDADGDRDLLYSRERIVIAPYGFSYKKAKQATLSPTNEELADGSNWELVKDGEGNDINHKEIAIARIISPMEA